MIRKLVLAASGMVILGLGGVGAFLFLTNTEAPPPPALGTTSTTAVGQPENTSTTRTSAAPLDSVEGTWRVRPETSFVGYRVQEEFLTQNLPNQAVGRTTAIEGTMTIEGVTVTEAEVTADLRELSSDEPTRDSAIRSRGLESNEFPEGTFVLTQPIDLGGIPEPAEVMEVTAAGDLTLHGQTRAVEFPLQAAVEGAGIHVIGSLQISFEDYGIEAPNVAGTIRVEPEGTIELDLVFVAG